MKISKAYIIAALLFLLNLSQCYRTSMFQDKLQAQTELVEALNDTVRHTQDKLGREVAEKRVLVTTVKGLESQVNNLSSNQKKLLEELKRAKKKSDVKAGIQIEESVTIDSVEYINSKTITMTDTKGGTIVQITNSNPAFRTLDVDALYVPEKKRWYNSKAFKVGLFVLGLGTGIYLSR